MTTEQRFLTVAIDRRGRVQVRRSGRVLFETQIGVPTKEPDRTDELMDQLRRAIDDAWKEMTTTEGAKQ
jgi:hypothetical protein